MNHFPGTTDELTLEQAVPHHANAVEPYKRGVSGSKGESETHIGLPEDVQGNRRSGSLKRPGLRPRSPWGRRVCARSSGV